MKLAYAGEVMNQAQQKVQQIIVEAPVSDPSWQDQAMNSLQQTVGPWGVTGIILTTLAGGGFWLYKKKFKK